MRLDADEDMEDGEVEELLSLEWESSGKTEGRVRFRAPANLYFDDSGGLGELLYKAFVPSLTPHFKSE